jgi:general secretion pathway protein H
MPRFLKRGAGRIFGHGVAGWSGKPGPHPERGFTLLELIAVLGLMALILALVLPGLRQSYGRERDRANLRRLVVALRAARSEAATNRQRVRVFLDVQNGQFRLEGSPERGQLTGMKLSESRLVWQDHEKQHGYVAFYGDGSSSGAKLRLEDPAGRRHLVEVDVITGRVSLKSGET